MSIRPSQLETIDGVRCRKYLEFPTGGLDMTRCAVTCPVSFGQSEKTGRPDSGMSQRQGLHRLRMWVVHVVSIQTDPSNVALFE